MAGDVSLRPDRLDAASEFRRFSAEARGDGAVASFTGIARSEGAKGERVQSLYLDHHPRLTLASMEAIAEAARQRFAVSRLRIVHRCGDVAPGDAIVFVAAASRHRRAAIEAVDFMMDRLKTDAVFWKREDRYGGGEWIEPTEADRAARARWGAEVGWN